MCGKALTETDSIIHMVSCIPGKDFRGVRFLPIGGDDKKEEEEKKVEVSSTPVEEKVEEEKKKPEKEEKEEAEPSQAY